MVSRSRLSGACSGQFNQRQHDAQGEWPWAFFCMRNGIRMDYGQVL